MEEYEKGFAVLHHRRLYREFWFRTLIPKKRALAILEFNLELTFGVAIIDRTPCRRNINHILLLRRKSSVPETITARDKHNYYHTRRPTDRASW